MTPQGSTEGRESPLIGTPERNIGPAKKSPRPDVNQVMQKEKEKEKEKEREKEKEKEKEKQKEREKDAQDQDEQQDRDQDEQEKEREREREKEIEKEKIEKKKEKLEKKKKEEKKKKKRKSTKKRKRSQQSEEEEEEEEVEKTTQKKTKKISNTDSALVVDGPSTAFKGARANRLRQLTTTKGCGEVKMPVKMLAEPRSSKLRELDQAWLQVLKERITESPVAHVGPIIVNVVGWEMRFPDTTIGKLDDLTNRASFLRKLGEVRYLFIYCFIFLTFVLD